MKNISDNQVTNTVDLSWMWHCSGNPINVLNYKELVDDTQIAKALTHAAAVGFRTALRRMEDLNLITMGDIDRNLTDEDQLRWNNHFEHNDE
jgi:hypothetical protein